MSCRISQTMYGNSLVIIPLMALYTSDKKDKLITPK